MASKTTRNKALGASELKPTVSESPQEPIVAPAPKEAPKTAPERRLAVVDLDTGEAISSLPSELLVTAPLERRGYSHSTIKAYSSCSASAYFKFTKAPSQPAYAMERGSALHSALELYLKKKRDPYEVLEQEWQERIADKFSEYSERDQEKIRTGFAESKRMLDEFIAENASWRDRVDPEKDVEVSFNLPFIFNLGGRSFTRNIVGKIDLVMWSPDRTRYATFDWKSSQKGPSDDDLQEEPQFTLYDWAGRNLYNKPAEKLVFYLLGGEKICGQKQNQYLCGLTHTHKKGVCKQHVHTAECTIYALNIKPKTDAQIQDLMTNYYAPAILGIESGLWQKNKSTVGGPFSKCTGCIYRRICDETKELPLPKFALFD